MCVYVVSVCEIEKLFGGNYLKKVIGVVFPLLRLKVLFLGGTSPFLLNGSHDSITGQNSRNYVLGWELTGHGEGGVLTWGRLAGVWSGMQNR